MDKLIFLPFAVYRLSRLIAYEKGPFFFVDHIKAFVYTNKKIQKKRELAKSLEYLVTCPYCLGMWFALILYVVRIPFVIEILGISGIQSLLSTIDRTLEAKIGLLEVEKKIVSQSLMQEKTDGHLFTN